MKSRPASFYVRALKPLLPAGAFEPARSRLLWLPAHLANIAFCIALLASGRVPTWLSVGLSFVIGASFAGLTFLAHETLHGAVVRGRAVRRLVGTVCFAPFMISPRLWIAWH